MFGVTEAGNSVAAHVHNFTAYFYVHVIEKGALDIQSIEQFRLKLSKLVATGQNEEEAVLKIEQVERSTVMNYQKAKQTFLKVYVAHPKYISQLRTHIEKGSSIGDQDVLSETCYETNVPYALRFMIDNEIGGMTWIRIEKGNWHIRHAHKKETHCQIEFDVYDYNNVKSLPCEGKYSKLAPLRILSFDIECSADKGRFPQPKSDPAIQIANIVKVYGENEVFLRNVFTLDDCAPIVGSKVFSYKKESEMLLRWRDFVK